MILLVGLATILAISYSWAISLKDNLTLKREMSFGWSRVGDHLQERFHFENNGVFPAIWIHLEDKSDLAGYSGSRITRIGGNSQMRRFERGFCERRGLYTIGPTSLHTSDPLGFFDVSIHYPATSNMVVMPPIFNLPNIQIAPGAKIGEGLNTIKSWDQTVTASGVREYDPGDSLRYIHWPTTARKNELFMRTFDSTPTSDQWIFMDMYSGAHAGEGDNASEEHGIILAASMMNWAIENGRAVGFGSNARDLSWHLPLLDETHKWTILRALALLEKGDEPVVKLLEAARKSLRFRSSVILITADLSGDWLTPLMLMRRKGIVPTVLLLNAPEFGGEGDVAGVLDQLVSQVVDHYLIGPDFLNDANIQLTPTTQKRREDARNVHWRPLL